MAVLNEGPMRSFLLAARAVILAWSGQAHGADLKSDVQAWRSAHERQIVGQLAEFTAIPSVAVQPDSLSRMAATLEAELKARGFKARLLTGPLGSPPAVFGALDVPDATRTIVFYAHYDGQSADPATWRSDPFRLVVRDGPGAQAEEIDWRSRALPHGPEWRLFGRGASDDKSSIVAFLAAFDALRSKGRKPAINIRVFWEGEEEHNSPGLRSVLETNRDLLKADLWLIGDGPLHQSRSATLYFGARGNVDVEATIYGPSRPLHSGHYGNWAPNPAVLAAQLITELRDPDGRILIPGFGSDVRVASASERAAIDRLPPVEAELRQEYLLGRTEGPDVLAASVMRPALNIDGLRAGDGGRAIPSQGVVSMDFRLVPDQTPERVREQVESYLKSKGWSIVHSDPDAATRRANGKLIKLDWRGGYPALRTPMDAPFAKSLITGSCLP
jgi:acetylornithine deacetylase/succinyl-diaminopimelate desuccinylase-like protein